MIVEWPCCEIPLTQLVRRDNKGQKPKLNAGLLSIRPLVNEPIFTALVQDLR